MSELAGPTGPIGRDIPAVEWPAQARVLAAHVRASSRVTGRPADGASLVTSLRLVGADWWAVWENGRFHVGFSPAGKVGLRVLVAWATRPRN